MKKFLAALLILGSLLGAPNGEAKSGFFNPAGGEVPFPWGSEIPFPWDSIEGAWYSSTSAGTKNYFDFKILSENTYGTKYFKVSHFDCNGNLVGEGTGISPKADRVVRVAMQLTPVASCGGSAATATDQENRYWIIVRAYERISGSKKTRRTYTYLTLLPFDYTDWNAGDHYRIRKMK